MKKELESTLAQVKKEREYVHEILELALARLTVAVARLQSEEPKKKLTVVK